MPRHNWTDLDITPNSYFTNMLDREHERKLKVWRVQKLVFDAVLVPGSPGPARRKVDALFSAFSAEWSLYVLTGGDDVVTALLADTTLPPWIDTDVNGTPLRTRIANRLG